MKEIRVDFRYFSRDFCRNNNIFTKLLQKMYKVNITTKNPDFVFFSNFDGTNDKKMPLVEGNFVKIFYTGENCRPKFDKCDYAFTFDYDEELKNPHHLRLPLYKFYGAGNNLIKPKQSNKSLEKIKNDKTKFCNYVYSKNAIERVEFFKKFSKYKHVDAPGKSMNNSLPIAPNAFIGLINSIESKLTKNNKLGSLLSRHIGDYQVTKLKYLKPYKFTIAFENSSYPGYTTEKIYHPMLVNSIPIYWGNSKISRDFNTKSFINYHDYNDINKVIDKVIEIDTNENKYFKMLKEPWYNKNKESKYVNDELIMKQLKKICG